MRKWQGQLPKASSESDILRKNVWSTLGMAAIIIGGCGMITARFATGRLRKMSESSSSEKAGIEYDFSKEYKCVIKRLTKSSGKSKDDVVLKESVQ